jgi:hypothetical protein
MPHTLPPPLSESARSELGTIGVVTAHFLPKPVFQIPAKGWLAGVGRGAANWSAAGASAPLGGGAPSGGGANNAAGNAAAGVVILALAVAAGTIGGMAGSFAGAAKAEPAEKVNASENILQSAVSSLRIHESMRDRFIQLAQNQTRERFVVLLDEGPNSPEEKIDYTSLRNEGIDTVVEMSVVSFGLAGPWDVNPLLSFSLDSHVRVIRIYDGVVLYDTPLIFRGGEHTFSDWAINNGQPFHEELEVALRALTEKIADELFLVYGFKP